MPGALNLVVSVFFLESNFLFFASSFFYTFLALSMLYVRKVVKLQRQENKISYVDLRKLCLFDLGSGHISFFNSEPDHFLSLRFWLFKKLKVVERLNPFCVIFIVHSWHPLFDALMLFVCSFTFKKLEILFRFTARVTIHGSFILSTSYKPKTF